MCIVCKQSGQRVYQVLSVKYSMQAEV